MAGPTIASAEVDVDFDGGRLPAQARRIANQAAKQLESGLVPESRRIGAAVGDGIGDGMAPRMDSVGRTAAAGFRRGFMVGSGGITDEVETQFRGFDQFFTNAGADAGHGFGDGFTSSIGDSDYGKEIERRIASDVVPVITSLGQESGDGFSRGFTSRVGDSDFGTEITRRARGDIVPAFSTLGDDAGEVLVGSISNSAGRRAKGINWSGLGGSLRKALTNSGDDSGKSFLDRLQATMGGGAGKIGSQVGDAFAGGFNNNVLTGMDRTVRAVIIAIAAMGPQLAALGSGLGASLTALLSSAIVGIGGALLALGGPLTAAITGFTLLATQWTDMIAKSAQLKASLAGLNVEWTAQLASFRAAAGSGIAELFDNLGAALSKVDLGGALGGAISQIASSFAALVASPAFTGFLNAMTTTFPQAFATLGAGVSSLLGGLMTLFTAAGPAAQQLADAFASWGSAFAASMQQMAASGQLSTFFDQAVQSISALMGFLGPLTQALGNVFLIGSDFGNALLGTLGQLAQQFLAFTQSAQGASQIGQWFAAGNQIFQALLPVIGAIGTALSQMVTPQVIASFTAFLGDLSRIIPVVGQLLSVIGNAQILEVFGELLSGIGQAIQPAIPALMQLAGVIGTALLTAVHALQPVFAVLGQVIAQLAPILAPLIQTLVGALAPILSALAPILAALAQAFMPIVQVVADVGGQLISALMPAILSLLNLVAQLAPSLVALFVAFNPVLRIITLLAPILVPVVNVLAQVISWLANLIAQAAPVINTVVQFIAQFLAFRGIMQNVTSVLGNVIGWFGRLGPAVSAVGGFFTRVGSTIASFATRVGGFISSMVTKVVGFFSNLGTRVPAIVSSLFTKVIGFFTRMGTRVGTTVSSLVSRVVGFFTGLASRVGSAVSGLVARVIGFFARLLSRVISTVSSLISRVNSLFGGLPGKVINAVSSLAGRIGTWIAGVFSRLVSGVTSGLSKVVDWFAKAPNRILNALSGAATLLYNVGSDIVEGLWNGLKGAWGKVTGWASDAFNSLSKGVKKVLGIGSPSKVFMAIGEDTVEGFVIGFRKQTEKGRGAFQKLSQSALTSMTDGLKKGSVEAGKEVSRILAKSRDLQTAAIKANQRALENTVKSVRKADLSRTKESATIAHIRKEYANLNKSVRDSGTALRETIRRNASQLTTTLKSYESVTKQLESARKKLDEMKKTRTDVANSIRQQLDLGSLVSTEEGGAKPTFAGVAAYVASMKTKAQKFASKMKKLVAAGIPPALIQQIAGLGLDGAIQVSDALLAGSPAQLRKLKADFSAFTAASTSVGDQVVKGMYGIGVAAQQGLINGLVSDQGNLKKAAKTFTDRLTKYVKQNLGIKSPSRVFANIGEQVMNGMTRGIVAGTGGMLAAARSATSQLVNAGSASSLVAPRFGTGSNVYTAAGAAAGRSVVVQTGAIQLSTPVADPRLVASQVLDRLITKVG